MKPQLRFFFALGSFAVAPFLSAQTLNFSLSSAGSSIVFDGTANTISFGPGGSNFGIYLSGGTMPGLDSYSGRLDGTFLVGTPSSGTFQNATVTGAGTFSISDGVQDITATLTLGNVLKATNSSSGSINSAFTTNVLNFGGYTGSDARLAQLEGRSAVFNLQFQFPGTHPTLTELMQDGTSNSTTTFNGTVGLTAIPESSFSALLLSVASLFFVGLKLGSRKVLV